MNCLGAFHRTFRVFPYVLVYDMAIHEPNKYVVHTLIGSYGVFTMILYSYTESLTSPVFVLFSMELFLRLMLVFSVGLN